MTLDLFDDRYGAGAHQTLLAQLRQPCVTFAHIAGQFGVTRERVRQWHRDLLPEAPSGHARQRLCALHQQRRRLFHDPLFRRFFRDARAHLSPGRIEPIRSRQGYRTRTVLIDKRVVALRGGGGARLHYRGAAEFVYVPLDGSEFLFAPSGAAGDRRQFRNTFDALTRDKSSSLEPAAIDLLQQDGQ